MQKPHALMTARIIAALSEGPRNKVELRNEVVGKSLTYQGFYKALTQLRAEEVVSVHRAMVSLSVVWLEHERERIEKIASAYHVSGYGSYFSGLKEKSKISFRFKTLRELDLFWTQAVLIAVQGLHPDEVILSYAPHDWFAVLNPSIADVWYKLLGKRNPHINVVTHALPEEKKFSDHPISRIESMFGVNPLKQKESVYLNVVGNLVFEAHLDQSVLSGIRHAMRGEKVEIEKLVSERGTFKLSIARNHAKARAIKKKTQKYFSIRIFN